MNLSLIGLLFDDQYYCHEISCDNLGYAGMDEWSTAFEQYKKGFSSDCMPPNEFFAREPSFLKNKNNGECLIGQWLQKPLEENILGYKNVIDSYVKHLLHPPGKKDIFRIINNYQSHSPGELELFLHEQVENNLQNLIIQAISKKAEHILSEHSINYLENLFFKGDTHKVTKSHIVSIISNYEAKYANSSAHAKFLSEVVKQYPGFLKSVGIALFDAYKVSRHDYDAVTFQNIENALNQTQISKSGMYFLAGGAKDQTYFPADFKYVKLFQDDLELFHENSPKLLKIHNSKETILYNSVVNSLNYYLDHNIATPGLIKDLVMGVIDKGYEITKASFDKIIDYYQSKVDQYLNLSNPNETFSSILLAIEKLVENNHKFWANSISASNLIASNIKLLSSTTDPGIIKNIIFVTLRMHQQYVELPDDILNNFAKFINSSDSSISRLSLNLYKKLSSKFSVPNINAIINMASNTAIDLAVQLDCIDILNNVLNQNSLNDTQIAELNTIKLHTEQILASDTRNHERLGDNIQTKSSNGFDNKILKHLLYLMTDRKKANWPIAEAENLLAGLNNNPEAIIEFKRILTKITDYRMSYRLLNRDGLSIKDITQKLSAKEWVSAIWKMYDENNYYAPKKTEELINDILVSNKTWLDSITEDKILNDNKVTTDNTEHLDDVNKAYINSMLAGISNFEEQENVSSWNEEQILAWKNKLQNPMDKIPEVMSVLKQALYLDKGFYPRDTQVISVLILLKSDQGTLMQIGTGEGKSVTIALFASIQVFNKRKIDIVTSASELAERDVDEEEGLGRFYRILGITVAANTKHNEDNTDLKTCYNADVVYGTLLYFIGDHLRDIYRNVKNGRGFDLLVVDEVDSTFIDQTGMKVQTSSAVPGFEHLRKFLFYIWGTQNQLIIKDELTDIYYKIIPLRDENDQIIGKTMVEVSDPVSYIKNNTESFVRDHLLQLTSLKGEKTVIFPDHLIDFVDHHITNWVEASVNARSHRENVSYVVRNNHAKHHELEPDYNIVPVDLETGTMLYRLTWQNGVSQFLQMHHGLKTTSEGLTSIFQSYVSYFLKYKGSIYGLTGTLGNSRHQEFLHHTYDVDFAFIPNFQVKKLSHFENIVEQTNKTEWLQDIADIAKDKAITDKRVVLIIAKNIGAMKEIAEFLTKQGLNVTEYGESTDQSPVRGEKKSGTIIVATNLAGRGTDLKLTREVLKNGGLHVIMSFFPMSIRTEDQGYGRPARQGEHGSAQTVFYEQARVPMSTEQVIEFKSIIREREELSRLKENIFCKLPNMLLQDKFFDRYVSLSRKIDSPTGFDVTLSNLCNPGNSASNACIYMNNGKIELKITRNGAWHNLEITKKMLNVDIDIYNHIVSILSRPTIPNTLSQRDSELIHFLIAIEDYSPVGSYITSRITDKYNSHVANFKNSPSELLSNQAKELWQNDQCSYGSLQGATNCIKNVAQIVFSISATSLGNFPLAEVAYLENQISSKDKNYDSTNLQKSDLLNAKLRHLYELWLEDRVLYTKEFEILQVQELWAMWLREQDELIGMKDNCSAIINRISPSPDLWHINSNRNDTVKLLNNAFDKFYDFILNRYNPTEYDSGKLFQNPAYVVRKAYDMQRIDDAQAGLSSVITQTNSFLSSIYKGVEQALAAMSMSITSPWYVQKPLDIAIKLLEKARLMDKDLSWQAYHGLAYMQLVIDSRIIKDEDQTKEATIAKKNFVEKSFWAMENLVNIVIPQLETTLVYTVNYIAPIHSPLAMALMFQVHLYKEQVSSIERNINITANSEPNEMIRVANVIIVEKLFDKTKPNITQIAGNYFNLSNIDSQSINLLNKSAGQFNVTMQQEAFAEFYLSGGMAFTITTYELKQDWSGTILSAVLGTVLIFSGYGLMTLGGPFFTSLGFTTMLGGMGDVLSSVVSVAMNTPINMDSYLRSKAIGFAISIATAGIAHIANVNGWDKGLVPTSLDALKDGLSVPGFIMQQFAIQASLMAATALLQNAGNQVANANDGDLERSVDGMIKGLLAQYREQLEIIFAYDEVNRGKLYDQLIANAQSISHDYAIKYNGELSQGLKTVLPNAARTFGLMASMAVAGATSLVSLGVGAYKLSEVNDDFSENFGNVIKETYSSVSNYRTSTIMEQRLKHRFKEDGIKMMEVLKRNNFITSLDIHYTKCNDISSFNFEDFAKSQEAILAICNGIAIMMSEENMNIKMGMLEHSLKTIVFANAKGIVKTDIVAPIASFASNLAVNSVLEFLGEKEKVKKLEEKQEKLDKAYKLLNEKNARTLDFTTTSDDKDSSSKGKPHANDNNKNSNLPKYKVKDTDTSLSQIAKEHDIKLEELIKANPNIINPNKIWKGNIINLPKGTRIQTHLIPTQPIPNEANKFFAAVKELGKAAEIEKNQCLFPWLKQNEFTFDPLEYMKPEFSNNPNNGGIVNTNNNDFIEGAIAATLTTIDQGTDKIFEYGVGKKSGWYKYHTWKAWGITSVIDYNLNLQEQHTNCPACDSRVNKIVAGVQTAVGNGLSSIGAVVGSVGGPVGSVAGAATTSAAYSVLANEQVGELARPIAQYIVNFYNERKK